MTEKLNTASQIREIASKIEGLSFLIERMGNALSQEEVFYGIGLIMTDLSQQLKKISNHIEGTN